MPTFSVTARRIVPAASYGMSMATGKIVKVCDCNHAGQIAIHVRLDSGFNAWGFGDTDESATADAVSNAQMIEAA